jgi:hypothetical protein
LGARCNIAVSRLVNRPLPRARQSWLARLDAWPDKALAPTLSLCAGAANWDSITVLTDHAKILPWTQAGGTANLERSETLLPVCHARYAATTTQRAGGVIELRKPRFLARKHP